MFSLLLQDFHKSDDYSDFAHEEARTKPGIFLFQAHIAGKWQLGLKPKSLPLKANAVSSSCPY